TFQTFPDDKKNGDHRLAKILHGTFAEHRDTLVSLNERGAGIFVMVNEGDGKGRKAENVTGIRGLFADFDGVPLPPLLPERARPHIIVETSLRRYHWYWLVTGMLLDMFTPFQKAIAEKFGTDPSVSILPGVARIPGFLHQKGTPYCSKLVECHDFEPYDPEELAEKLGIVELVEKYVAEEKQTATGGDVQADDAKMRVSDKPLNGVPEGQREVTIFKYSSSLAGGRRVTKREARILVDHANRNNTPPLTQEAVDHQFKCGWKYRKQGSKRLDKFRRLIMVLEETGGSSFQDQYGQRWICVREGEVNKNIPIGSSKFGWYMTRLFAERYPGEGVGKEVINQFGDLLAATATERRDLYNRYAFIDGKLYIDMANEMGDIIEVSAEGYRKVKLEKPPFKRFSHQQALPDPEPGGSVSDVFDYLPPLSEYDRILIQIWLVTAMLEHIPRPGLILHGAWGGGKSTAGRILRSLIDPSIIPSINLSNDNKEVVQMMDHHAIVLIDNLSGLPRGASDQLCRAVTGEGVTKRVLYSDDDDFLRFFRRTFILIGINLPSAAPDLLDRSLIIELPHINDAERCDEVELLEEFERARGKIFGAILETMASAMKIKPTIELTKKPRMADFATYGCAAADKLGIGKDRFLEAYRHNRESQNREILNDDVVCQALLRMMEDTDDDWEGRPTDLFDRLHGFAEGLGLNKGRDWPKAPNVLSRRLKMVKHILAQAGLFVEWTKGQMRRILIRKVRPNEPVSDGSDDTRTGNDPISSVDNIPASRSKDDTDGSDDISQDFSGRKKTKKEGKKTLKERLSEI
ncbi:MAG: hypothetical protein FJY85_04200, partial [Deltaproteobacteria bacterium]|nr:hypothetical protein [Deltaproteobacteria bacterium]